MCQQCGTAYTGKIYRSTLCPVCDAELKTCLNCKFYAADAHWECRETIPEPVREKNRSNFCDYFSYVPRSADKKTGFNSKKARGAFDTLFGNEQ